MDFMDNVKTKRKFFVIITYMCMILGVGFSFRRYLFLSNVELISYETFISIHIDKNHVKRWVHDRNFVILTWESNASKMGVIVRKKEPLLKDDFYKEKGMDYFSNGNEKIFVKKEDNKENRKYNFRLLKLNPQNSN